MANSRRPSKPQIDYYSYMRQRDERLRARAEAEGRQWAEPQQDAQQTVVSHEEESKPRFNIKALSGLGDRLKRRASGRNREDELYEEPADELSDSRSDAYSQNGAAYEQPQPDEQDGAAYEQAAVDAEGVVDIPEAQLPTEAVYMAEEADVAEPSDDQESNDEYALYEDADAETEKDGNEDNPFSALLRTTVALGGHARDLYQKLRDRVLTRTKHSQTGDEPDELDSGLTDSDPDGLDEFSDDAAAVPDEGYALDAQSAAELPAVDAATGETPVADMAIDASAGEPPVVDATTAETPVADAAADTGSFESQADLYEDDYQEEGNAPAPRPGFIERIKGLFSSRSHTSSAQDEFDEDDGFDVIGARNDVPVAPVAIEDPAQASPASVRTRIADGMKRFMPVIDEADELNFAATEVPANKEGTPMNEQNSKSKESISELLAKDLESAPVLSRRERKALAAQQASAERAFAADDAVDEPTQEFTPVNARDSSLHVKPVVSPSYPAFEPEDDEEDDEKEERKTRRGLFSRRTKAAANEDDEDVDDEDDEDDEEDDEDYRPRRKAASRSKRAARDDDDEDDEEDEDEPRGRYDRYDDDDDEDDDEDYEDDRRGFGSGLLRFLRGLLILVIIGALVVLGLRELEKRDVLSMNGLRELPGVGSFAAVIFPDPDVEDADTNDVSPVETATPAPVATEAAPDAGQNEAAPAVTEAPTAQ